VRDYRPFAEGANPSLMFTVDQALAFQPRSTRADHVRATTDSLFAEQAPDAVT
jgi:hypothetical protein